MHILFLSCLKATELIEKKWYDKLSGKEKVQLKMHKAMCKACKNYETQSAIIEKALAALHAPEEIKIDISNLKKSILDKLEKK